jgi:hypothetical protein
VDPILRAGEERERMWSSSQASTRGVVEMGRVEAGPSHFPKRPAPQNSARYKYSWFTRIEELTLV